MKNSLRTLLVAALLACGISTAGAQLTVQLSIKRHLFIAHEPILATVTLSNLTGRALTLEDTRELQWFGFQINGAGDSVIAPRNPDYHTAPLQLAPGETTRRTVNLNELYDLGDYGVYKVRAAIHVNPVNRYFTSKPLQVEVSDGKVIWQQGAGVPEGIRNERHIHLFSLLSHQQDDSRVLYVRIEDKDDAVVFCTYPLGRMIDNVPPQAQFDAGNNLYILQFVGLKSYVLSKIGVNGEFMGQTSYSAPKSRPTLRKLADGTLQIVGGHKEGAIAQQLPTEPPIKLSDRPEGLKR